jgi:Na+-driven multidrug efflux pump
VINIVDGNLFGVCQATAIIVGQSLGADNPKRAREVAYKTTALLSTLYLLENRLRLKMDVAT